MPLTRGVKLYDVAWYARFGMTAEDLAAHLRAWGVTDVLAKTGYLSGPGSDFVPSGCDYTHADDQRLREALAREGIGYWITVCMFYDLDAVAQTPALRPVGADGVPMPQQDWYLGIVPSQEAFVARQIARITQAVAQLQPEGVFLSFMRWPGFWERWMPQDTLHEHSDYSFDAHTLARFTRETGIAVPGDPQAAATWLNAHAREAWTDWKCGLITRVVGQVRAACLTLQPGIQVMLNTLPFGRNDFGGARERVFGQRIEELVEVVDVFEVMTYHQILKRSLDWIGVVAREVKARSKRRTLCTLQASPLYGEGIYAAAGRAKTLDAAEFSRALAAAAESADGFTVFTLTDLLEATLVRQDTRWVDALQQTSQA